MNIEEAISGSPIFSSLGEKALSEICDISETRRADVGEMIFSEGEDARALFILVEGEVDLVKYTPDGRERFVRHVGEGETFAEAAMFAGEAYPVSAVARRSSTLIAIDKGKFHKFVCDHPDASIAMLGAMARLLRHWSVLLSELSLTSVESRIATWLIRKSRASKGDSFKLGIPKKELAFKLGTIPETLSRNLRKLTESGTISMDGDEVTIGDLGALEDIASR
jgi:CRP-like cAMP-binding protein